MVSISADKLKQLESRAERAEAQAAVSRGEASRAEARILQFDSMLTKLIAACDGRPMAEERNAYSSGYGAIPGLEQLHNLRPTQDEKLEMEIGRLHERIVTLECRLAAARAVAEFAKSHKA